MSDTYYTVGVHGAPTPETAPHGFMWRYGSPTGSWQPSNNVYTKGYPPHVQWWPLPAPPTEQAPPPEPEPLWTRGPGITILRRVGEGHKKYGVDDADYLVDIANALDRDGVAWGPGRPMSELPETGRVLVRLKDGLIIARANTIQAGDFVCWWPLPGEAQ